MSQARESALGLVGFDDGCHGVASEAGRLSVHMWDLSAEVGGAGVG